MNSNRKVRVLGLMGFARIFEDALNKTLISEKNGLNPSCVSCVNFDEPNEICKLYKTRPPARVIALACEQYKDSDDIPF